MDDYLLGSCSLNNMGLYSTDVHTDTDYADHLPGLGLAAGAFGGVDLAVAGQ